MRLVAFALVLLAAGPALAQSGGPTGMPVVPSGYAAVPPPPSVPPPVAPAGLPPPAPGPIDPSDPTATPPGTRANGEMADLYVSVAGFGFWTGVYVPLVSGAFDGIGDRDEAFIVSGAITGAVFSIAPLALDLGTGGMPDGVPGTIAMGLRYGVAGAALAVGTTRSLRIEEVAHLLWWSGLSGGVLGTLVGYAAHPHPAQVQFVQVTGLWGAVLGLFGAFAFAPFASSSEVSQVGFGIALGGFATGLVTGTLVSAFEANPGAARAWGCTLGLLAGAAGGTALWAIGSLAMRDFDEQGWGVAAGIGAISGLVIALAVSGDDRAPTHHGPAVPAPTVSVAPTLGGASLELTGRF